MCTFPTVIKENIDDLFGLLHYSWNPRNGWDKNNPSRLKSGKSPKFNLKKIKIFDFHCDNDGDDGKRRYITGINIEISNIKYEF